MSANNVLISPVLNDPQYFDDSGYPLSNGSIASYFSGTSTPANTYTTQAGTVLASNPILLDGSGRNDNVMWLLANVTYKLVLADANNITIDTYDNVYGVPNTNSDLVSNGNYIGLTTTGVVSVLIPPTAAEITGNTTIVNGYLEPGDVRRYGIVPNAPSSANTNTLAMNGLINWASNGYVGDIWFTNTTGNDTYYFSDVLAFRPGCYVDLQGCTLNFNKITPTANDQDASFIMAQRDFQLRNGNIIANYAQGGPYTVSDAGNVIGLGTRENNCVYFGPTYDSHLPLPQGNMVIENLYISSNVLGAAGFLMFGGLQDCVFRNIRIEGNNQLWGGMYYEFGFATQDPGGNTANQQSSHMHNCTFENIVGSNISNTSWGIVVGTNGAYNIRLQNIYADNCQGVCSHGSGESLFYNPWVGVDDIGTSPSGRTIDINNVVSRNSLGVAITVGGTSQNTGYLRTANVPITAKVDQLNLLLDGFVVDGGTSNANGNGYGVQTSGGQNTIRNGKITNKFHGIDIDLEGTLFNIENITIANTGGAGIVVGQGGTAIYPAGGRYSVGRIAGCFIAGSGVGTSGGSQCIVGNQIQSLKIENNRFGFEPIHDNQSETAIQQVINLSSGSNVNSVICENNYVAALPSGAIAWYNNFTNANNCHLINNTGNTSTHGAWVEAINGVYYKNLDIVGYNGDANTTLTWGVDETTQIWNTTFTTDRAVAFSATNAVAGAQFNITRRAAGAHNFFVNGINIANTANCWATVEFDGSAWQIIADGSLT